MHDHSPSKSLLDFRNDLQVIRSPLARIDVTGRIALYSHDTMGLGHIRRNLLIGQTLAEFDSSRAILLISGTRAATHFELPTRVDCVTLPGLRKEANGRYAPRRLSLDLHTLTRLRAATIRAALEAFDPDLLIVDNVPAGADAELTSSLAWTRERGTHVVLGLRDVLDAPEQVREEWRRARNEQIIANHYDEVWVYGDRTVYDPAREYDFSPALARKLKYTGYLNQCRRLDRHAEGPLPPDEPEIGSEPIALCLVGGGEDGARLAEAFARASAPGSARRVIVTGPFMARDRRRALEECAARDPTLTVLGFIGEPGALVEHAACVIAMGGYNTTCEVLSFNKRALIVPRVWPRLEQWIRAQRLQQLGLVDMLSPEVATSERLTSWLAGNFGRPVPARASIDLDGLIRVRHFAHALAPERSDATPEPLLPRSLHHVV